MHFMSVLSYMFIFVIVCNHCIKVPRLHVEPKKDEQEEEDRLFILATLGQYPPQPEIIFNDCTRSRHNVPGTTRRLRF
ncbi:hypothetical protein SNEBB_005574 [Seison nebaliae]|nr:hypothetical protein SNEBB_005574 [Seison nebaliae]